MLDLEEDVDRLEEAQAKDAEIRKQEAEHSHQILSSIRADISKIDVQMTKSMSFIGGITFTVGTIIGLITLLMGPVGEYIMQKLS